MIYIASDHKGFEIKNKLKDLMREKGIHLTDLGPFSLVPTDDYPLFALELSKKVIEDPVLNKGILICSSGTGMAIAANKVKGIRAGEVGSAEEAKLARLHNDCNVLVLSLLELDYDLYSQIIEIWLNTPFSYEERHIRRLKEISDYEAENFK
jgi:ribose 5-phosphate isomerase B